MLLGLMLATTLWAEGERTNILFNFDRKFRLGETTDAESIPLIHLELDPYYLEHRSFWMDAKILWQTFAQIALGRIF